MKLSARTTSVLKNFATINNSIVFNPGNELATISQSKTIMAKAKVDTEFTDKFGVYDLPQFLGAISLFDNPELTATDRVMQIRSGNQGLDYVFSDPSLIQSPPSKEIKLPQPEVEFELKGDVLTQTLKALSVIGSPEIAVIGDGEKVYLSAINSKNSGDSTYRVEVGETDKTFKMIFMAENIKLLPGDYQVAISSKGLARFGGDDIEYFVAVESNSSYEG